MHGIISLKQLKIKLNVSFAENIILVSTKGLWNHVKSIYKDVFAKDQEKGNTKENEAIFHIHFSLSGKMAEMLPTKANLNTVYLAVWHRLLKLTKMI
jgi:hypothetical protein